MTSLCYFTDKLSAEIRIEIYKHIFGPATHIKRTVAEHVPETAKEDERVVLVDDNSDDAPTMVDTAIVAMNKSISAETIETLCNTKIVRLTFTQMYGDAQQGAGYLHYIRELEFVDSLNHFVSRRAGPMNFALDLALHKLPRVKSVVILSDYFAHNPNCSSIDPKYTVRLFAQIANLGYVECVDIGQFVIKRGEFAGLKFVNSKLCKMWPHVKTTPHDYDAFQVALQLETGWEPLDTSINNKYAFAAQTSLRQWVGMVEVLRATRSEPPALATGDLRIALKQLIKLSFAKYMKGCRAYFTSLDSWQSSPVAPLHQLGPGHNSNLLELATDFLALNIETFCYSPDPERPDWTVDAKAYWPELEGGESIGTRKSRAQARTCEEWARTNLVLIPCSIDEYLRIETVRELLLRESLKLGPIVAAFFGGEDRIESADRLELQKMFYLMIAIEAWAPYAEYPDPEEFDKWSAELLRTYFLRIPSINRQRVIDADLEKLRKVFEGAAKELVGKFEQDATGEVKYTHPIDDTEDEDVYLPLLRKIAGHLGYFWAREDC